jgi:DNA-binding MarR family transcriptional regulator
MGKTKETAGEYKTGTEAQEVRHRNPIKELGFAAMEHALTLDTDLSDGAYRTYALLKFYWQNKYTAFPTVDTMATQRGLRRETVGVHLKELVDKGLITRQPRVGTSTLTHLEDLPEEYSQIALAELERRDARREENLTATLGKSNVRREINLTQSTTIEREKKEEEAPAENVYSLYQKAFGDFISNPQGTQNQTFIEALQEMPLDWVKESFARTSKKEQASGERWRDYRRLPYALKIAGSWKDAGKILPEPTYPKQSSYQRPKPGPGRAPAPVVQGNGWDYSKPITDEDRKRFVAEHMAARKASMSAAGGG